MEPEVKTVELVFQREVIRADVSEVSKRKSIREYTTRNIPKVSATINSFL